MNGHPLTAAPNQADPPLSPPELQRYARHLLLPEIGMAGQLQLRAARVLCVGAGGLGSPVLTYLAAAGIGHLGIVDDDAVDLSNLQRQILHGTPDLGRPKTDSARATIQRLNPHVEVTLYPFRLTSRNAREIIAPYDIVVDGTDNFPARYLINDACVLLRKTNVYGAVFRFEGQASVFAPIAGGPCYRCLYPEPPPPGQAPSCADAGVLGVLPGLVGCIQAAETLKLVLNQGSPLLGRLLLISALDMKFRELKVRRDPACAVCGEHPTRRELIDETPGCTGAAVPETIGEDEVTVWDLKHALEHPELGIRIVDIREPAEHAMARLPSVPLIPLATLPEQLGAANPEQTVYLLCRAGVRSLHAVRRLKPRGWTRIKSVRGGLLAWAEAFDPSMRKSL